MPCRPNPAEGQGKEETQVKDEESSGGTSRASSVDKFAAGGGTGREGLQEEDSQMDLGGTAVPEGSRTQESTAGTRERSRSRERDGSSKCGGVLTHGWGPKVWGHIWQEKGQEQHQLSCQWFRTRFSFESRLTSNPDFLKILYQFA